MSSSAVAVPLKQKQIVQWSVKQMKQQQQLHMIIARLTSTDAIGKRTVECKFADGRFALGKMDLALKK